MSNKRQTTLILIVGLVFSVVFGIFFIVRNSQTSNMGCNPNYSGCVTSYNCDGVGETVDVIGADVYGLDGDGDGKGCDLKGTWLSGAIFTSVLVAIASWLLSLYIFNKKDVKNKKKEQELERQQAISEGRVCPECNGTLMKKKGRYGSFYGCERYPVCKYTTKDFNKLRQ